ncbi:MAG: uroporphyrinogen decarboxylase family protein [Candidatus Latescibacterota bacterium]
MRCLGLDWTRTRDTGISDDFSGLLSPEHYEEFALSYRKRIYEAFGTEGRNMHSELLTREHRPFLSDLGVTHFDPGCDQHFSVRDLVEVIPEIPFSFNLKTAQDMLMGTPDSIRAQYRQAVSQGGHGDAHGDLPQRTQRTGVGLHPGSAGLRTGAAIVQPNGTQTMRDGHPSPPIKEHIHRSVCHGNVIYLLN